MAETKAFTHPVDIEHLTSRLSPGDLIVDVGCGQGRVLKRLESSGFTNLAGADLSESTVAAAPGEVFVRRVLPMRLEWLNSWQSNQSLSNASTLTPRQRPGC